MPSLRNFLATMLVIAGGCIACFFIFFFDIYALVMLGAGRNAIAMNGRLVGVIAGIGLAIFGAIVRVSR